MVPAYNGSEPYIFVSYAHKDSADVYSTIEKLTSLGYRIWYDEGIKPGVEWPENIAEHLDKCSLFLMFISPNSMASANCRREINFALSRSKKFLCIVLKKTEIPLGMELQLASQQSIFRYKYTSEEAYIYKICSAAGMSQCKNTHFFEKENETAPKEVAYTAPASAVRTETGKGTAVRKKSGSGRRRKSSGNAGSGKGSGKTVFIGLLVGAIIICAFTFYMLAGGGFSGGESNAALTPSPSPTVTVTPVPEETLTPTPAPVTTQQTQVADNTTYDTQGTTGGNNAGTSGNASGGSAEEASANGGTEDAGNTEDENIDVEFPNEGAGEAGDFADEDANASQTGDY